MKRMRMMGLCLVAVFAMSMVAAATASAVPGLMAWGQGTHGQLGNGSMTSSNVPVAVSVSPDAISVASGFNHSVALVQGGEVEAWGEGLQGELGNGTFSSSTVPVKVCAPAPTGCSGTLSGVVAVAAGDEESLAVLSTGEVVTWGWGEVYGQLGTGSTANSDLPVKVCALPPTGCSGTLSGVVAVAAGEANNMALLKTGEVVAWGANNYGQLGNSANFKTTNPNTTPVKVEKLPEPVMAISAGASHDVALLSGHEVVTWGRNDSGQLGNGKNGDPTDTYEPQVVCAESATAPCLQGSNALAKVASISAGGIHVLALLENSNVVAWGRDEEGQLGNEKTGTINNSDLPIKVCAPAGCSSGPLGGTAQVSAGYQFSEARLTNGEVRAWGENKYGNLGDGTSAINRTLPVAVCSTTVAAGNGPCPPKPAQTQVIAISAGYFHSLALGEAPHYFSGGLSTLARIVGGENTPFVAWGTLTLTNESNGVAVTCHVVTGGFLENPVPGGKEGPAGAGATEGAYPYNCESPMCAVKGTGEGNFVTLQAESLPWRSHLFTEGSAIRSESEGIKLDETCHVKQGGGGFSLEEVKWEGSNRPNLILHCCKAIAPPEVNYGAGSGTLHKQSEESIKAKTEGALKMLGYKEEEVINGKVG